MARYIPPNDHKKRDISSEAHHCRGIFLLPSSSEREREIHRYLKFFHHHIVHVGSRKLKWKPSRQAEQDKQRALAARKQENERQGREMMNDNRDTHVGRKTHLAEKSERERYTHSRLSLSLSRIMPATYGNRENGRERETKKRGKSSSYMPRESLALSCRKRGLCCNCIYISLSLRCAV